MPSLLQMLTVLALISVLGTSQAAYLQTATVTMGKYVMTLDYTIDSTSINMQASVPCLATDYIAVAFVPTMKGDTVVGFASGGVQAQTMNGHPTPVVKANSATTYFTNQSFSYNNGVATMTFSRLLTGAAGDYSLSLTAGSTTGSIPMSFAVGPAYKHHYVQTAQNIAFQVSSTSFVAAATSPTQATLASASSTQASAMSTQASATTQASVIAVTSPVAVAANLDGQYTLAITQSSFQLTYSVQNGNLVMTAVAKAASTDYISVGFTGSSSPDLMSGADAIIGASSGVFSYLMPSYDFSSFVAKDTSYVSNPSYSFDSSSGMATLTFTRALITGNSNDVVIDLNSGVVNMIFATGPATPVFGDHGTNRWSANVPISAAGLSLEAEANSTSALATSWVLKAIPLVILVIFAALSLVVHRFTFSFWFHQTKVGFFSVGELTFWLVFFGSVVTFVLLDMKVFTLSNLTGKLSIMILALTLCPISRTSLWVKVFNVPLERATPFHIFLGVLTILMVAIHLVFAIIAFSASVLISTKTGVTVIPVAGTIAFLSMFIMSCLGAIRRSHWEIFYYTHRVCSAITVAGTLAHSIQDGYYLLIPVVFYLIDLGFRYAEGFRAATILNLQVSKDVTSLYVKPSTNTFLNFESGSYAFIRIPSLGGLKGNEWHPFSIASAPSDPILTFHIKNMGRSKWTGALHEFALDKCSIEEAVQMEEGDNLNGGINPLVCYLNGPYGSLNVSLTDSTQVVLFAGGIGITPFLSIFKDLLNKKKNNQMPKLQKVRIIWVTRVRHLSIESELMSLRNEAGDLSAMFAVTIYTERPSDFDAIFEPIVTLDNSVKKNHEVDEITSFFSSLATVKSSTAILACGPEGFVKTINKQASKHKFQFHKETFEL